MSLLFRFVVQMHVLSLKNFGTQKSCDVTPLVFTDLLQTLRVLDPTRCKRHIRRKSNRDVLELHLTLITNPFSVSRSRSNLQ